MTRIVRGYLLFLGFIFFTLGFPVFAQTRVMNLEEALRSLDVSGAGKAEFRWDPLFASGTISAGEHEASFISGKAGETGVVILDRKEILTLPLPYLERGNIRFPETFITQVNHTFSRYAEEDLSRFRIAAIIIDPGHGGRDPGTMTPGGFTVAGRPVTLLEKNLNLKVARQVHASLAAAFPDKKVLITRETDTAKTLEERVDLAHSVPLAVNEAAIFISIHCNASTNNAAKGYEVWYLSPSFRREVIDRSRYPGSSEVIPILNSMLEEEITAESSMMASSILKRLDESIGKTTSSRGLKAAEWFVVRNVRMPSVLVEMPFLTNADDALLMSDDAYLMKLSEALYKGISDFIAFFERTGGYTAVQ
jgi:N-acetylmuramoyl-L-alanine amidase